MNLGVIADAAAGPFAVACALLAFAGVSKVRRPVSTAPAARALGLPAGPVAVRTLGIVEIAAACAGLVLGGGAAAVVAVVYLALAVAAGRLLVQSPGTACGCVGASDAPVTVAHVVVNCCAVVAAVLAVPGGSPLRATGSGLLAGLAFVLLVGCGAALVAVVLDGRPALGAPARPGGAR